MLPSNFYGNRISYNGHSLFKPWRDQYHAYTSRANECLAEYSQSGVYNYEINLDLENFFPSIDPRVLFQFIRAKFPLKWENEDTETAEVILRKLLLFELDPLDETEWKWYLNDENAVLPQGTLYAKGQPQGLPHAYFMANLFMFDAQIKESRVYVVLYNGTCYKLVDDDWQECALEGDESYFTNAYLSLPYETDANTFAYEQVKVICGDSPELRELYNAWMPEDRWTYEELKDLFCQIDRALNK